jgi:cytochrome c oxidase subunit 4
MKDTAFAAHARRLGWAWLALLALMLTSLGSSYVPLGVGNAVTGIVIAIVKSTIVVWLFMRFPAASTTVRIVAATGLATWLLLMTLSGVDYATRSAPPVPMQQPQQLQPLLQKGTSR